MHWRAPIVGDTRVKSGFLFFPKWIAGEWRWLEFATWGQTYEPGGMYDACEWRDTAWITVH